MGCGTSFAKYVLFFFNLLFALVGMAIVAVGVTVLVNWRGLKSAIEEKLNVAPWVFIVIGVIVFVIAFFGCCGAIRESHCMVVTYAIFLLVIIIVQVALAVLLFVYSESIKDAITKSVEKLYKAQDPVSAEAIENLETQLQCCGLNGPSYYGLTIPDRCCTRGRGVVGNFVGACTLADSNSQGCAPYAGQFYEKWNKVIAGVAIGVACVEVVGALFALCLANSIRNMDRRSHY